MLSDEDAASISIPMSDILFLSVEHDIKKTIQDILVSNSVRH